MGVKGKPRCAKRTPRVFCEGNLGLSKTLAAGRAASALVAGAFLWSFLVAVTRKDRSYFPLEIASSDRLTCD